MRGLVFGGERHRDGFFLTGLHAFKLLDEAGDEGAAADLDIGVGGGAAREGGAIDLARVIDGQHVALGGALAVAARGHLLGRDLHQVAVAFGDVGHRLIDFLGRHRGDMARQAEGGEIRQRDVRQQLQLHLEFQILGRAGRGRLDRHHFQLRHHRGPQRALGQQLLRGLIDRLLHHLGRDGAAEALPHDRHRHLARPESWQIDLFGEFGKPRQAAAFNVRRGNGHGERAPEAVGKCLGHLHLPTRPVVHNSKYVIRPGPPYRGAGGGI